MGLSSTTAELAVEPEPPGSALEVVESAGTVTAGSMAGGVIINYLGVLVVSGIGFFLTPYLIHQLGATNFGVMALSTSMISYASLLDFGIGISVMKLIADRVHEADRTGTRKIVSTVLVFYTVVGAVVIVVALLAFPLISGHFHVPPQQAHAFHVVYVLAALTVGLTFPQSVFSAVVTGHRDFSLQNSIVIATTLFSALGTVLLLKLGGNIIGLGIFAFEVCLLQFAAKIIIVKRRYAIGFARRYIDRAVLPVVMKFASWVFIINIASKVIFDTDTIVIGALIGPAAVAVYQVALSPNVVLRRLGEQYNVVALTGASTLQAQGNQEAVRTLFLEATRMAAVIMLPFAIVFGAWGGEFVRLWVGNGFRAADDAVLYLSMAMIAIAIQGTASQIIMAYSKHRVMAIATICEATANLTLSIILGKHYGIKGVALGTLLPTLITALCVSMPYAAKLTGTRATDVVKRLGPPIALAVALGVGGRAIAPPGSFSSLAELVGVGVVIFATFVAFNILISAERKTYISMVTSRLPRGARPR